MCASPPRAETRPGPVLARNEASSAANCGLKRPFRPLDLAVVPLSPPLASLRPPVDLSPRAYLPRTSLRHHARRRTRGKPAQDQCVRSSAIRRRPKTDETLSSVLSQVDDLDLGEDAAKLRKEGFEVRPHPHLTTHSRRITGR